MRRTLALLPLLFPAGALGHPLERELPTGGEVCWLRQYDSAHFVKHPDQKVASIALSKARDEPGQGAIALSLLINLRQRTPPNAGEVRHYDYANHAFCKPAGKGLRCEGDSGLGPFYVERSGDGLLVKNPGVIRFNPSNYDSEDRADNHIKVLAKPDDAAFRLDTRGPKACPF